MMLNWIADCNKIQANSTKMPLGRFLIVYDGTTYWPNWSKESSDFLEDLKLEASLIEIKGFN